MKYLSFFAAGLFFCAILSAENPAPFLNWSLLAGGSWEEVSLSEGTLHNRGEFKLNFLPAGLTLRGEVLDRRKLNFSPDLPLSDPQKQATNFLGALYHKPTGSRLLYGALDEWGLSARIRNPWIRSPPYAENHSPLAADLKTAASSTKNDEAYLYLSSPQINILSNVKMRGFITAQTEIKEFKGSLAGGMDFILPDKTGILLETFYTGAALPETKNSSWFTNPPPLPEREFKLYAAGFLFHNQFISAGGDLAVSETFAWGTDMYGNIGISLTPSLPFAARNRPLLISFAADGAGERFVFRDGAGHGAGFRAAGKIEWRGKRSSLLRLNTVLRGQGIGGQFDRSSTGFYYRFPAKKRLDDSIIRFTRMSFTADRNAENLQKISNKFTGHIGISLNLQKLKIKSPLGINFSGSIIALTDEENAPSPYPVPKSSWNYNSAGMNCEFIWSPLFLQFKSNLGYANEVKKEAENEEKWDFSVSSTARFKNGRISLKAASPDFPEKWNFSVSWRLELN